MIANFDPHYGDATCYDYTPPEKEELPKDNYRFLRILLARILHAERFPPRELPLKDRPVKLRWFLPITHKRARPRVVKCRNAYP